MALGSTQPLVKMSTRDIPGGKGGRCIRLTTYHHTVPLSRNLGAITSQNPLDLLRPVTGQLYLLHVYCTGICLCICLFCVYKAEIRIKNNTSYFLVKKFQVNMYLHIQPCAA